jgi:hypothetical protein
MPAVKSKQEGVGIKDERRAIQPFNSSALILPPSSFLLALQVFGW